MTKSGRSIQKPTSFVPPPPSPTTNKRKRPYNRRNPESAVCKVCLRGVSPASNMIVFCDGCNTAYHQWCHKPPIDQAVIDEADKEWHCMNCEEEKAENASEMDLSNLVSAPGTSEEQRRAYFASLPHGTLATLLVRATTQKPDLAMFDPKFRATLSNGNASSSNGMSSASMSMPPPPNPHTRSDQATTGASPWANGSPYARNPPVPDDTTYTDDVHPSNYPRPGQGLMSTLPPETGEELQWLVDDDDKYGVFTHIYQDPAAAGVATTGNGQSNGT
ncbi:SWM histone demethylase complex subunit phf1 [Pseudocercospora fuligena]|uniref:SWM histone demethylase complex subunit phf1 n=1 Tax=Pseudocercospora fuligena TaxID=685502 RepID=A0A8H6VMU6_9PEZI|nr:SWM histone demethylase complex subunit phf1 [Pseudocercospora fuligena]